MEKMGHQRNKEREDEEMEGDSTKIPANNQVASKELQLQHLMQSIVHELELPIKFRKNKESHFSVGEVNGKYRQDLAAQVDAINEGCTS